MRERKPYNLKLKERETRRGTGKPAGQVKAFVDDQLVKH